MSAREKEEKNSPRQNLKLPFQRKRIEEKKSLREEQREL